MEGGFDRAVCLVRGHAGRLPLHHSVPGGESAQGLCRVCAALRRHQRGPCRE